MSMDWDIFCGPCSQFGSSSTGQSGQWPQHEHPACMIGESDFPSHPTKPGPQRKYDRIYGSPGALLFYGGPLGLQFRGICQDLS